MDFSVDYGNLTNRELVERYDRVDIGPPEVDAAYLVISNQNQNGFAPVPDRQVIIDYLIQEEPRHQNNNNSKSRRINGGRKARKSRKNRKSRKCRKSRRGRRR